MSNAVISGILINCGSEARVLYDYEYMHSFVSPCFALKLDVERTSMEYGLTVITLLRDVFIPQFEYKSCVV